MVDTRITANSSNTCVTRDRYGQKASSINTDHVTLFAANDADRLAVETAARPIEPDTTVCTNSRYATFIRFRAERPVQYSV